MTHSPEHLDGLAYSRELVQQVEAEAQRVAGSWLPWAQVLCTVAISAAAAAWVIW